MSRKIIQGPVRDKEKTKERMLQAVGSIINQKGYRGLTITAIARAAKVDKKLVYDYFGSTEKLIETYVLQQDYWNNAGKNVTVEPTPGGIKKFTQLLLQQQFEALYEQPELQQIILWELSEDHPMLRQLANSREEGGEILFRQLTDPLFKDSDFNFRAVMALLIAGGYYLNIHTRVNGSTFCGLDLTTPEGREAITDALKTIVDWSFEKRQSH